MDQKQSPFISPFGPDGSLHSENFPRIEEASAVLPRSEIPAHYKWDLSSIFPSLADFEVEYKAVTEAIPQLERFKETLLTSPATLYQFLVEKFSLKTRAKKLETYAGLLHDSDTAIPEHQELKERSQALVVQFEATSSFELAELSNLTEAKLAEFISEQVELRKFEHYLREIIRAKPHIRSPEVERILARAEDELNSFSRAYSMLIDTDLKFGRVPSDSGAPVELTQGNVDQLLLSRDRRVRQAAWSAYTTGFQSLENGIAAIYTGFVRKTQQTAEERKFDSSFEASLFEDNIPHEVYFNILRTCAEHYPVWQRYFRLRAKALGVSSIREYDLHAPLCPNPPRISFEQAVSLISAGLAPLGSDYVETLKKGLLTDRWADVLPNRDKRSGAYSAGSYGTPPHMLLNYTGSYSEVGTLVHEGGHSMQTFATNKAQPSWYSDYSIFVAEVASNLNQALLRASMIQQGDKNFKLAVLDETFTNFFRYLFIMPTLARFEFQVHEKIKAGEGLSASSLSKLCADLFKEGFGDAVEVDEKQLGTLWMQFSHLYEPFYVYQYASGIAAANALAVKILSGDTEARTRYHSMLSAGSSLHPLQLLKIAGVDLTSSQPVEEAFRILSEYLDRLEATL